MMTDVRKFRFSSLVPFGALSACSIKLSHDGDDQTPSRQGDIRADVDIVERVQTPRLYKVVMLNDDYTPMEFVILCLQRFFRMGQDDAIQIMLRVHQKGAATCGVFPYGVAETKCTQVIDYARQNGHPLCCTLEEA